MGFKSVIEYFGQPRFQIGGLWRSASRCGGFEVVFLLGVFMEIFCVSWRFPQLVVVVFGNFLCFFSSWWLFLVVVVGGEFGCGGGCWSVVWWWQGGFWVFLFGNKVSGFF